MGRQKAQRKKHRGKRKKEQNKQEKKINDYIHANYIAGYNAEKSYTECCYIAAQGPNQLTSSHFWEMVVLDNIKTIVCLTRMAEVNSHGIFVPKCEQYFPKDRENSSLTFTNTADAKTKSITRLFVINNRKKQKLRFRRTT